MKASELIARMQSMVEKYGDLPTYGDLEEVINVVAVNDSGFEVDDSDLANGDVATGFFMEE